MARPTDPIDPTGSTTWIEYPALRTAEAPPPDSVRASTAELLPAMPLWQLALLMVVTFNGYAAVWFYGASRHLYGEKKRALWNALGSLLFPTLPVVSMQLTRKIAAHPSYASGSVRPNDVQILLVGIGCQLAALMWIFLADGALPYLAVLLSAGPVLLLQARLNRAWWRGGVVPPSYGPLGWKKAVVLFVGGVFAVTTTWRDRYSLYRLTGHGLEAGTAVSGELGGYELTTPSSGWVQLSAHALGDEDDVDLTLSGPRGAALVVVHVSRGRYDDLDAAVDQRRRFFAREFGSFTVDERRSFLPAAKLVATSLAHYRQRSRFWPREMIVLTAEDRGLTVEVVSWTDETSLTTEISQLLSSLKWRPRAAAHRAEVARGGLER